VFNWPNDGRLLVPGLRNKVVKAYLLAAKDESCNVTQDGGQVAVAVPQKGPDSINTVVVLEIEGKPDVAI
jgi:alpha-L-fucosidase